MRCGAVQVEARQWNADMGGSFVLRKKTGGERDVKSSYLRVVLLPLLGRGGGCGGLLPAKKVDAIVEAVDRRTNMIVREKRRAGGTRSSHIKQMERRFDQKAWTVDEHMGGEADE